MKTKVPKLVKFILVRLAEMLKFLADISIAMISKTYAKWIPKNEPDYINKLAKKLGKTY